jgi:hypothetical protein
VVSFTPRPLYPWGKSAGTHKIGSWVGPRTGLDDVKKRKLLTLLGLELRPLRRLSHSQSHCLYGSYYAWVCLKIDGVCLDAVIFKVQNLGSGIFYNAFTIVIVNYVR